MAQNGARFSGSLPRSSNIDKPILAVVSQQAKRDQIQLTRYEQDGESLRVWVDNTSFDDAAQWIERLSRTQGVQVGQINIDRQAEPGRVDLRVTFTQG
jgi:general secretion pathway protein M